MALVNNDHLARKSQMPQHNVLLCKCRQQQLIHCANHKVCQQCLLVSPKPLVYLHLMLFLRVLLQLHPAPLQPQIALVQFRHAVRQLYSLRQRLLRLRICPAKQPGKNAVCRGLCGQPEKDTAQPEPAGHDLRSGQRRLGFAHAHLCFQDQDTRFRCGICSLQNSPLHRIGRKAEPHRKLLRVCDARLCLPREGQGQLFPSPVHPRRVILHAAQLLYRDQGEVFRIAGDPVCHDQKSGQKHFLLRVQVVQFRRIIKAAVLQNSHEQFCPKALPDLFLSLGVVVALPALQLIIDRRAALWPAVMRPHNGGYPAGTIIPQQNCLSRPGMRRLPAVLFRTVQRRQHFQPLPRLRQSAQDICLKGYRSLAYIMDPAQKPGMREQRFLALKAHGPFCTFREPLPDQPLHDARRIPQVHPERQPQAGILRVRFTSQKPCFIQRPAHFCSFSGVCFPCTEHSR